MRSVKTTIILVFCLLFARQLASAQHASLKGRLIDSLSGAPIELATVAITRQADSSLITYTLTKKDGSFDMVSIPANSNLYLFVSHVGFNALMKKINLSANMVTDAGVLTLSTITLEEVIISGTRAPVVIRNDTIEFRAEAFKTMPNANVEALLKKLPGLQVFPNGAIVVNGKPISKIKVNGKDFFSNNTLIATRNLDAEMIDKVQIFDEYGNSQSLALQGAGSPKVINLVLKSKFRKNIFGKAFAGGGTGSRYEAGGIANSFLDSLQTSIVVLSNNLNQAGFNLQELGSMGGFGTQSNSILTSSIDWGGRFFGGVQSLTSYGTNINYIKSRNTNISLLYYGSQESNRFENHSESKSSIGDTTLSTISQNKRRQMRSNQNLEPRWDWQINNSLHLSYSSRIAVSSENDRTWADYSRSNNMNSIRNQNFDTSELAKKQFEYRHSIALQRSFRNGSLSINQNISFSPSTATNNYNSAFISTGPSSVQPDFHRTYDQRTPGTALELGLNYSRNISNTFQSSLGIAAKYNYSAFYREVSAPGNPMNPEIKQESADLNRTVDDIVVKAGLSWQWKKLSLSAGLENDFQTITKKFSGNISNTFRNSVYFPLPQLNIRLGAFSLDFSSSVSQPGISDLTPGQYRMNNLTVIKGNPELKYSKRYNLELTYYKYMTRSNSYINVYGNYTNITDPVAYVTYTTTEGLYIQQPDNLKISTNTTLGAIYNKSFSIGSYLKSSLNMNCFFLSQRNDFNTNSSYGIQRFNQLGIVPKWDLSYNTTFDLETSYSFTRQHTSYQKVGYQDFKNVFHSISTKLNVNWPASIIWSPSLYYMQSTRVIAGQSDRFNQLNFSVTFLPGNRSSQLKLTCFDLLNKNTGFYSAANANTISISSYLTLKRYFLLTYQYKFLKSNKRSAGDQSAAKEQ